MKYEYLFLAFLGFVLIAVGILNLRGNLSTIHWYCRRKVSDKDAPKYGKAMGTGTLIIGISIAFTGILQTLFYQAFFFYLILIGIVVGVAVLLYAQFKYNRGIF